MRPVHLLLMLLLVGCKTTAIQGAAVWGQQVYTLNTEQACSPAAELVQVADALVAEQLTRGQSLGLWDAAKVGAAVKKRPIGVCMIERPEACCQQPGYNCAGPYLYEGGNPVLAARKAGCSGVGWAWVSRNWPPVCTARWPEEPHCTAALVLPRDWRGDLRHEINHGLMDRAGVDSQLLHTDPRWAALDGGR